MKRLSIVALLLLAGCAPDPKVERLNKSAERKAERLSQAQLVGEIDTLLADGTSISAGRMRIILKDIVESTETRKQ